MLTAADHEQDLVQQIALAGGAALTDEVRAELLRRVAAAFAEGRDPGEAIREVIGQSEDLLAALLADAQLAALLLGGNTVLADLPPVPPRPPFGAIQNEPWGWDGNSVWLPLIEGAIKDIQRRQALSKQDWEQLEEDARRQAFAVARLKTQEAAAHVQQALTAATQQGWTLRRFRQELSENFETSALGPGEVENVFRTGTMAAYGAGFEAIVNTPGVADEFPYRLTDPIHDDRLSELCAVISRSGIQGTNIFRADDPVWRYFRPPRHYQCRCAQRALTIDDAADLGIREAREWLRTGIEPVQPAYVSWPSVQLPKGWTPGGVGVIL